MSYFTFKELTRSQTAEKLGINNMPDTAEKIDNLDKLREKILDPLREAYGKPIYVTSGYRCKALNTKIGGATSSQHMSGEAVDIYVLGHMQNPVLTD